MFAVLVCTIPYHDMITLLLQHIAYGKTLNKGTTNYDYSPVQLIHILPT